MKGEPRGLLLRGSCVTRCGIGRFWLERWVRIAASEAREWRSWRRTGVVVEGGSLRMRRMLLER